MKVVTIVGARPQFIKCAPVSRELRKKHEEILVHTGQHYDYGMSDIFFEELAIPKPDYNLGIGSGNHGAQTGAMLAAIEEVLLKEKPDWLLLYGDTNSTVAGALAAAKLQIPIIHVEAGLRSYDRNVPEEVNRVISDHLSNVLFCPTETAVINLQKEGITQGVYHVGDVMMDAVSFNINQAEKKSNILNELAVKPGEYIAATIHRPFHTDYPDILRNIISAFGEAQQKIVFPIHPRTKKFIHKYEIKIPENVIVIEPLGYLDMLHLMKNASRIITDSGGVQKEAYMVKTPCITLRDIPTEWVETLNGGWNKLVSPSRAEDVVTALVEKRYPDNWMPVFGDGTGARQMIDILESLIV